MPTNTPPDNRATLVNAVDQTIERATRLNAYQTYENAQRMIALKEADLKRALPASLYRQARLELHTLLKEMQTACDNLDFVQTKAVFIKLRNYQPVFKPAKDQKLETAFKSVRALFHNLHVRYETALDADHAEKLHGLMYPIMTRASDAYKRNDAASVADIHGCMDDLFKFLKRSDVVAMLSRR